MPGPVVIYALSDPDKPELVRYVGKTWRSMTHRLRGHMIEAIGRSSPKTNWINGLRTNNSTPCIWPLEVCTKDNWESREAFWIKFFKPLGIFNICRGGKTGPDQTGFRHSEETKRLYREQRKGRTPHINNRMATAARNKRGLSEQSIAKMAAALSGRKMPDGVMEKIKRHPSYRHTMDAFAKANLAHSKQVVCIETGEVFKSIHATARAIGKHTRHLKANIQNGWKTGGLTYVVKGEAICPAQ